MKILGIAGSPRADGNTSLLVRSALKSCSERGAQTEFISLAGKEIQFCDNCDACAGGKNPCPKTDDVQEILDALERADGIIVGTPTYFGSVSGQLKTFFDRTLPLRRNNLRLSGKVGGAIAVGGSRSGGQEQAISDIHNWMMIHEMVVVSDKKTAHFGGISVARNPGDALNDVIGIETASNLGERVFEVLKKMTD
jgi:multimeric flavodoxin WrbA